MNFKSFFFILLLFFAGKLVGQEEHFSTKLPLVYINTDGKEIIDDPRIKARMDIAWKGDGEMNSTADNPDHFNGDITIEIRGSSSQYFFPKKSYGLELKDEMGVDMDFPILGMPEEEDWILYGPYSDKTLLRNILTFTLAEQIRNFYVPRCRFVELFVNERYDGVYVMMEQIKRDSVRVDVAKLKVDDIEGKELTGGYIFKIDKQTGGGGDGWYSQYRNSNGNNTYYQYDYPKSSIIHQAQKDYIRKYVHDFETAILEGWHDNEKGIQNYMNFDSFFDVVIINELSKNVDGYRLSTFLYKDKADRLNAGPIWDFNLAFGNADYYNGWDTLGLFIRTDIGDDHWQIPFWWKKLLQDEYFIHPLKCKWEDLRQEALSDQRILNVVDSLIFSLGNSIERNFTRWPVIGEWIWPNYYVGPSYESEVDWMKNWIIDRVNHLDEYFPGICGADPTEQSEESSFSVYPNPFRSTLSLNIHSQISIEYRFVVFNINGQKVKDIELNLVRGRNNIKINTETFGSGVYIYKILGGDYELETGKIIKL